MITPIRRSRHGGGADGRGVGAYDELGRIAQTHNAYRAGRKLELAPLGPHRYRSAWYDPRSGFRLAWGDGPGAGARWEIPARPEPADEDWVLVLETTQH